MSHANSDPTPALQIGNVALDFPVVQAALSGYSDRPMRVIARRLGAPYTLCEVMLEDFVVQLRNRKRTRRYLTVGDDEHPVGGQLMGSDPLLFAQAAARLAESGFDVIDINFGCPSKKEGGKCRGGLHLGQPEVALDIVARVREAVPEQVPVTVKMRRGLDDTPESRDKFYQIFDGVFERGVAAVTVHGRTVEQRYVGPSNWGILAEVKRHAGQRTILVSGDLFTAEDCLSMMEKTGVDGVTAARGAIGNPWIFDRARRLARGESAPGPTIGEQRRVLDEHRQLAEEEYGDDGCASVLRKFGIFYARMHPQAEDVRRAFIAAKGIAGWGEVLDQWYPAFGAASKDARCVGDSAGVS
ncbi:MAG: tRNA dihydrouridine synthase [Planctomycetaceae bacterium]